MLLSERVFFLFLFINIFDFNFSSFKRMFFIKIRKALIYLKRYQEAEKCFLDGISCLTPDSSPSLRRGLSSFFSFFFLLFLFFYFYYFLLNLIMKKEFESWAKKAKKDGEASPATSSSSPSPSPSPSSSSSSSTSSSTTPSSSKGAGPSSFVGSEAWEVPQGEVDQLLQFVAKGDEYIQQKNYRVSFSFCFFFSLFFLSFFFFFFFSFILLKLNFAGRQSCI